MPNNPEFAQPFKYIMLDQLTGDGSVLTRASFALDDRSTLCGNGLQEGFRKSIEAKAKNI